MKNSIHSTTKNYMFSQCTENYCRTHSKLCLACIIRDGHDYTKDREEKDAGAFRKHGEMVIS